MITMHIFIQKLHKHLVLASFATLMLAAMTWFADSYINPSATNAAASTVDVSLSVIPYPMVVASEDSAWFLLYYKTRWGWTAEGIQVSTTLPAGMTFVSSYPATYTKQGNTYTWTNLPNNYWPVIVEVTVAWAEDTTHTVQATVSTTSNDVDTSNNEKQGSIRIINTQASQYNSDMQVLLTTQKNTVDAGAIVPYTIKYKNNGPDTASESVIVMTLPSELTYVTGTKSLDPLSTTESLVWKLSDITAWSQGEITVNLLVSNIVDQGEAVFSYVTISSTNNDNIWLNNQAYKSVVVSWVAPQQSVSASPTAPWAAPAWWAGGWAGDAAPVSAPQNEQVAATDNQSEVEEDLPVSSWFLFTVTQDDSLTVPSSNNCASSQELQSAYTFAHSNDITTMATLAQARMCDGVIRSELAKMISNYAINVLGKKPNTSIECAFNDMDGQPEDLQQAAITACQLGLMGLDDGIPARSFNPKQTVTRAIFGTAFSRLLYGDAHNNAGSNWYDAHLTALFADGIIKNTTPTLQELRWYIMIMMQRSEK